VTQRHARIVVDMIACNCFILVACTIAKPNNSSHTLSLVPQTSLFSMHAGLDSPSPHTPLVPMMLHTFRSNALMLFIASANKRSFNHTLFDLCQNKEPVRAV
jgi:hypothetical protein